MATCPTCRTHYPDGTAACSKDGAALLPDQAFASADAPLLAGAVVGEYEIEGLLGEGGFGAVYKAVHPLIGKAAAVKLLKREFSSNPEMVSRFISEARAVNQIRHRNIIDIFSFGALPDGRQFFVMELLEGIVLDKYLERHGRLSPGQALPILKQLARALGAAHAAGIAHRDMKPENVFLTFEEDGKPYPKLLDFGIAKLVKDAGSRHKTQTGTPLGTPLYMSPEQVHGRDVDQRTDIYSLGIVAFEMLTGKLPFDGTSVMDILMKQAGAAAPKPSSVCDAVPAALDAPILHMMEKDPAARPNGIVKAIEDLERAVASAGLSTSVALTPIHALGDAQGHTVIGSEMSQTAAGTTTVAAPSDAAGRSGSISAQSAPYHSSMQTSAAPPPSSRTGIYAAIGGAAIAAIAIGGFALVRKSGDSKDVARAATTQTATASQASDSATASQTKEAAPLVVPMSATASAAPASSDVKLKITSNPPDAEVWRDNEKLGATGQELKLPRGATKVKLTIKKAGYLPQVVEVTPSDDVAEPVILTAQPVVGKPYEF
jgi:serine/threonine-protein kinase